MKQSLTLAVACVSLCGVLAAAQAAADPEAGAGTDTRPIDARVVRVKVDGAVDLRIRQGRAPALTLSGDPRWLSRTTAVQSGDTLNIDTAIHGHAHMGALHAELTLPALREVRSDSFGSTDIAGFSGDSLDLSLDGAGSMRVTGNYRVVTASLGGIGSMRLQGLSAEGVALTLQGAGFVSLSGHARWLKVDLGGLGSLDAQQFAADSVNLDLSGLGNASVNARRDLELSLSGMGSVTVYGKPLNRKVEVDGLGKVSWK